MQNQDSDEKIVNIQPMLNEPSPYNWAAKGRNWWIQIIGLGIVFVIGLWWKGYIKL